MKRFFLVNAAVAATLVTLAISPQLAGTDLFSTAFLIAYVAFISSFVALFAWVFAKVWTQDK